MSLASWRVGELNRLRLSDYEEKKHHDKKPLDKLIKLEELEELNFEKRSIPDWIPAPTFVRAGTARGRQMYGLAPRNSKLAPHRI